MINGLKKLVKRSPIALSKNHLYDIQTRKIIKRLRKNSNCIDVGCYKGEILDLILDAAPDGQHFGIEPLPIQYKMLSTKYERFSNCTVLNYAASDVKGESSFNYVISNPPYSGLLKRDYDRPEESDSTITVKTDLLDNLVPENLGIDFIKIDVEGAELLVLRGASELIAKNRPIVVFEHGLGASNYYDSTPDKIYDYFISRDMFVSNLSCFLKNRAYLSCEELEEQYFNKRNFYFVAHR